jgi:hypothetical protein
LPDIRLRAGSVNEAYSKASKHFEPKRVSHTGNVFDLASYFDTSDPRQSGLRPLRALREAKEAVLEARFQLSVEKQKV